MCCPQCDRFETCYSAATLRHRILPTAGLPPDHYVLCRTTKPCNERCNACPYFLEAMAHPPTTMMLYHCCSRCKEFAKCKDFVARHLEQAKKFKTVGAKKGQKLGGLAAAGLDLRRSTQSERHASPGQNAP